jgi:hypothetical protein
MKKHFSSSTKITLATDDLHKFVYLASIERPDVLMIDLDFNTTDDNIVNALIKIVEHYDKLPMIIMANSGYRELFEGRYEYLKEKLKDNIKLVGKPLSFKPVAECIIDHLTLKLSYNEDDSQE